MRYASIDALKLLCAFLVINIHTPFNFYGNEYYIALSRIAVPCFFIISGYFYQKQKASKQIKKIFFLILLSNLTYAAWSYFIGLLRNNIPKLSLKDIIKFLMFNESPFSYHLWYLGAILYILIIISTLSEKWIKALIAISPVLLLTDLILGKYSLLLFGREFPVIIVRNWLFVGVPFFVIGMLMRSKNLRIGKWGIPVFSITSIAELFLLHINGVNATRDQYISTIFLSVAVCSYAFEYKGSVNDKISEFGRKYSTAIYIIHPIFITCFYVAVSTIGAEAVWNYISPVIIFISSLTFLIIVEKVKNVLYKKRHPS